MLIFSSSQRAIGSIAAIFIILILAVMGATVVSLLGTDTTSSINYMHSQQSFFIAEAGLQYYMEQLENQTSSWASPPTKPSGMSFGAGNFTITTSNEAADEIDVISTSSLVGVDGQAVVRVAKVHVIRSSHEAFSYFAYVGSNINCRNTEGSVDPGNLYCGGSVQRWDSGDFPIADGPPLDGQDVTVPTVDFAYYQSIADYTNVNNFDEDGSPYNGIYYYDGNVNIDEEVTINGSIIATGNIVLTRAEEVTINPTGSNPALISGNNIKARYLEDSEINGLIYADNNVNFRQTEDVTVEGAIIAGNTVNFRDAEDLDFSLDLSDTPPGFSGGTSIETSAWDETY